MVKVHLSNQDLLAQKMISLISERKHVVGSHQKRLSEVFVFFEKKKKKKKRKEKYIL